MDGVRIKLRYVELEPMAFRHEGLWGCITHFSDGKVARSYPHDTHHYHVISHRCGYGEDIEQYCLDHDFVHSFLAEVIDGAVSSVLWAMAHDKVPDQWEALTEEALVQTFQAWLRANVRPILADGDWDIWKREALSSLNNVSFK